MLKLLTLSAVLFGLAIGAETESSSESSSSESSSESTSSESTSSESTESTNSTSPTSTSSMATTATPQKHNDVTSNYYYTYLDTSYFAFAIGQCTQKSLLDGSYMLATCLDTDTLQVNIYGTAGCSDSLLSTVNYTSADGEVFYCGGDNTYAKVTISILGCTDETYDVYTALDVCVAATNPASIYTSVYCSGTYGEIQYYLGSTCADAAYYSVAKMNSTCQYLFTTSSGSTKIYGKLSECVTSSASTATTTASGATTTSGSVSTTTTSSPGTTTSAANNYNIFTAVALLFVAVVYIATL